MEKPIYPLRNMRITQRYGKGTHVNSFAIDDAGKDTGIEDVYAPFTGTIKKIYPQDANEVWLESDNPVEYPDGTIDYMTILFAHANDISKLGCYIYIKYVCFLLEENTKEEAYNKIKGLDYSLYSEHAIEQYKRILKENIKELNVAEIKSTGYVVDTLECALWILLNANSFKETIIATTNIGNDTDTIGAIAGSMAGIIYGIDSIPENWLNKLQRKDYLIDLISWHRMGP